MCGGKITCPSKHRSDRVSNTSYNLSSPLVCWPLAAHASGKMPVLDIQTWVEETDNGTLTKYEFYRKPMSNPVSIPAGSALPNGTKFDTYRQEVMRILRNTSIDLLWSVKAAHLTDLSWRIKLCGCKEGFRSQFLA